MEATRARPSRRKTRVREDIDIQVDDQVGNVSTLSIHSGALGDGGNQTNPKPGPTRHPSRVSTLVLYISS